MRDALPPLARTEEYDYEDGLEIAEFRRCPVCEGTGSCEGEPCETCNSKGEVFVGWQSGWDGPPPDNYQYDPEVLQRAREHILFCARMDCERARNAERQMDEAERLMDSIHDR